MASKPKSKTVKAKPKTAKTAATKSKPKATTKPNFGYTGSLAERMDLALLAGGTWDELATKTGVNRGVIRSHARFRGKGPKYKLIETEDHAKLVVLTEVAA